MQGRQDRVPVDLASPKLTLRATHDRGVVAHSPSPAGNLPQLAPQVPRKGQALRRCRLGQRITNLIRHISDLDDLGHKTTVTKLWVHPAPNAHTS